MTKTKERSSMALQESIREQIIKQFDADVIILQEQNGTEYYACPTCKRQLILTNSICPSCDQHLKWDNVHHVELEKSGTKTATLSFEVPGDFSKSDCRKCPLSYIARLDGQSAYECPLNMRNNCPLEIE